jgi:DNA processing protein
MNKNINEKKYYLLALNRVTFLTPRERLSLINIFSNLKDVFRLKKSELSEALGRRIVSKNWHPDNILRLTDNDLKEISYGRIKCLFYFDKEYPAQLKEIYDPPLVLFYRGELFDNKKLSVSIVGTRKPKGNARRAAFMLGYDFGKIGVNTVSGLAAGIDTESHKGTVMAGGVTVAVLGSGVDIIYPGSNKKTAMDIIKTGGMILSEFPPGTLPLKYNFPCRNRIISGLSSAVVIVQAPSRSGSLITADYALDQGREIFVHAEGLNNTSGRGTEELVKSGAAVISNYKDVLVGLGYDVADSNYRCCIDLGRDIGKELAELMELELSGYLPAR